MKKFFGTYQELQDNVLRTGLYGEWIDLGNQKQFRTGDGGILNWWQSTKTFTLQGNYEAMVALASALGNNGKVHPPIANGNTHLQLWK